MNAELIEPKEIEINGRTYILSKVPAVLGREMILQYVPSNLPKIGDRGISREMFLKLMAYVAVRLEGIERPQRLETETLINNHIPDGETLCRLEVEMLDYNFGFFGIGKTLNSLKRLRGLADSGIEMLTALLGSLSAQGSQPSGS